MDIKGLAEYSGYYIEVYQQEIKSEKYQYKYEILDNIQAEHSLGTGVRVFKEGKVGQYYSTEKEFDLKLMIKKAIDSLAFSSPGKIHSHIEAMEIPQKSFKMLKNSRVKLQQEMASLILRYSNDVVTFPESSLGFSEVTQCFYTSTGVELSDQFETASAVFYAKAVSGDEEEAGYDYQVCRQLETLSLEKLAQKASAQAVAMLGAKRLEKVDRVELDYPIVVEFLELLLFSFSAENVVTKQSLFLQEKHRQLDPKLTLIDNGVVENGIQTTSFDGEGQKRQRTVLVESGKVINYISNVETASQLGISSSGNASRKNLVQIGVSTTNVEVLPGSEFNTQETNQETKVLITEVMGTHMVNTMTGEFSLGAKGVLQTGTQNTAVRGFVISGNFIDLFKNIESLSTTREQLGSYLVPKMTFKNIHVTSDQ